MSVATQVAALAARIAGEINTLRAEAAAASTSTYLVPVYVLETTETESNIPADFPAGGLIFKKTA